MKLSKVQERISRLLYGSSDPPAPSKADQARAARMYYGSEDPIARRLQQEACETEQQMPNDDYEEFEEFEIVRNHPDQAAILFKVHDSALDDPVWIPRSLLILEPDRLQVKTWFCRKEGLI